MREQLSTTNDTSNFDHSFQSFVPTWYLSEYYSHIGSENANLLCFFVDVYKNVPKGGILLELGGGPTIYQLISAAPVVKEIHFSDYLMTNLNTVKDWKNNSDSAFDWNPFIYKALKLENRSSSDKAILNRKKVIQTKIKKFIYCDAFLPNPLGKKYRNYYDIVSVNFVPESITGSKYKWRKILKNITSLLKDNGLLIMSSLKNAAYWKAGDKDFPAVSIQEKDVYDELVKLSFSEIRMKSIAADETDGRKRNFQGYKGMILTSARFSRKDYRVN